MPEPRYKSLLVWEPFPYILLFVLVVIAGSISPGAAPIAFWIAAVLAGLATVFFIIAFVVTGRGGRGNPDAEGNLRSLDGLEIVSAGHDDGETRPFVSVEDARRHQASIEIALAHGGEHLRAVLVPRASRWLSLRYRVGVQLVAGDRIRHAGFLPDTAEQHWVDRLGALRREGAFVSVPARIRGAERPRAVELDVSGLAAAIEARSSS